VLNVKNSCLVAVFAATIALTGLTARTAVSQQPVMRGPGVQSVALVDVNYIFKKHGRFKAQMEQMRADVERSQAEWKRQMEAINKQADRLQEFRPGTPDYKAMEEDIVNQKAKLQGQVALQKKEFLQREAKIYYNTYSEIMQEVRYHCQQNGLGLILSFNGDKINPENPEDVLRGINNKVVYYDDGLDITPIILKRLNPDVADRSAVPTGPQGVSFPNRPR
jgi:Skp family chaperone for outer membrane proteins